MTAEVVLMNKQSVAMAADSAGTIGGKIFNSHNKLFMLSKYHPIGIMVYSSAEVMGYPWETIIKTYRKCLKTDSFKTVDEQVDHFLNFLKTLNLFNKEAKDNYITESFARAIIDIQSELKALFPKPDQIKKDVLLIVFNHIVDNKAKLANKKKIKCELDEESKKKLLSEYKSNVDKMISSDFKNYGVDQHLHDKIYKICEDTIFSNPIHMGTTGIVISGFGTDEVFPATIHFEISSIFDNQIMMTDRDAMKIALDNSAIILPFAQREMVSSFVEGINPKLDKTIRKQMNDIFEKLPNVIADASYKKNGSKKQMLKAAMETATKAMRDSLYENLNKHIQEEYVTPIIDGVANLPPDELSIMAETLVNITSFKRRVSANERETVGGPIDVAVITKGDGFIWVKRKHYFKPDKNHHFFNNYFKEAL